MEIKYRTESFSGTEVRAVRDVICYEVCELGNTDILETLANGLLKGTPYGPKVKELIMRISQNDDIAEAEIRDFCDDALEQIREQTGKDIQYALWLASKEDGLNSFWRWANGAYQDDAPCPDPAPGNIDAYETGPVVLSANDGDGGTLYGYEQYPVPLEPKQWFYDFLKKGE